METLVAQEKDTTNRHSFFNSKEHYLAFTTAWKQYIANGNHICRTYVDSQGGTCKYDSALTSVHHLVYNALRKRDLYKSFTPLTNKNKIGKHGLYAAYYDDLRVLRLSLGRWGNSRWVKTPFGETVTDEMLKELIGTLADIKL